MTTPKFTPGPWHLCHHLQSEANDKACGCGFRGNLTADGEFAICEMGPTVIPGEEGLELRRYPRPVEIANAHLIAAAPEMYEALIEITRATETMNGHLLAAGGNRMSEVERRIVKARLAIAKAEGS